jgi:sulfide:quinone oxidoreductase
VAVDRVDLDDNTVHLADGTTLHYDVLVVATGATLVPEETEGLTGPAGTRRSSPSTHPRAPRRLETALADFDGGRIVVNVVDMPIKCPVAPLEFCFLADWYFTERGIRDQVQITYVTPLDGAFTKPVASAHLGGMLEERGIELVTEFNTGEVDGPGGKLVGYDEREVPFDLAVVIPLHGGGRVRRPLARPRRRPQLRAHRPAHLQSRRQPNVFAIGDATNVPASKAGLGHPLRGRGAGREHRAVPRRRGARRGLRRPRQLLHRDRVRQGDAHRLQLRDRAAARPLPRRGRACPC